MYPNLSPTGVPEDKKAQIQAALANLRTTSQGLTSREERIYDLWTLSELMLDHSCCSELVDQGGMPFVLGFLSRNDSTGKLVFIDTLVIFFPIGCSDDEGGCTALSCAGCQAAAARIIHRMALSPLGPLVYGILIREGKPFATLFEAV